MIRLERLLILIGLLCVRNVYAFPVTIDANNYEVGTEISHLIGGVTMQTYYHPAYANTINYSPVTITYSQTTEETRDSKKNLTSTYENLSNGDFSGVLLPLSLEFRFKGLSISSNRALDSFGFTGFSGSGDTFSIGFYGKNNNLLWTAGMYGTSYKDSNGYLHWNYSSSFNLIGDSVYRVDLGGWASTVFVDSVTYDVPEASSLGLLAIGLFMLGINIKRKKMLIIQTWNSH